MRPRIYIDTSVVGGYFDEEFRKTTELFFQQFQAGNFRFVVSDLLDFELLDAPPGYVTYCPATRLRFSSGLPLRKKLKRSPTSTLPGK